MPDTLAPLRGAIRLSLWTWTLYWPLGGLMLLLAGMHDPASIAFLAIVVATFTYLLSSGALRTEAGVRVRSFLRDRPVYLFAAALTVVLLGAFVEPVANLGLWLFSASYLGAIVLVAVRLRQHLRATAQATFAARADQLYIVCGMALVLAVPLFADMLLQVVGNGSLGTPGPAVAALNLMNVAYPSLLLVASRPFRAPGVRLRLRGLPSGTGPGDAPALAGAGR